MNIIMGEVLLNQILACEIEPDVTINAIKFGKDIQYTDGCISLAEFVPFFLSYIHEKLNVSLSNTNTFFSQRQQRKQKCAEFSYSEGEVKKSVPKKSPRLSLQYASSSPMKGGNDYSHSSEFSLISPIKTIKAEPHKKKKYASTSSLPINIRSKNNFELNSLDDFPAISFSPAQKNPRRIRATTVTTMKSFISSKNDASQTNSPFLEESSFESQHGNPSLDKLFLDEKRFSRISSELSIGSPNGSLITQSTCDELDFSLLTTSSKKVLTPTKFFNENFDSANVQEKQVLDILVEIYTNIWMNNLIPNFTLELYFLFITLTLPHKPATDFTAYNPFQNVQSCVYFAASCVEKLEGYICLLDEKVLNLLLSNSRLKLVVSAKFLVTLQNVIDTDISRSPQKIHDFLKSPMTGIPFQVESDNRKSFASDKHFHLFSKKRDAFYALVREWQDNYLDPEWNFKQFMAKKVPEIMRMNTEVSTHNQFSKLFVAQLLETCRNHVGGKNNESDEGESSLLVDLKKRNPTKYQSLQDRLTQPSFSNDPCPKPSFSIVEQFFKEFIDIADSYCFSKILQHVLLSYILELDSKSFDFDYSNVNSSNNSSAFADSLWTEIFMGISDLRLLAKFLGYVIFRPYNYSSEYIDEKIQKSRHLLIEPLDLTEYLETSFEKHKLLITVPWVVDFFSMADKHAFDHDVYSKTMKTLVCLYRSTQARLQHDMLLLSLVLHIGWLFELPHVTSIDFYGPSCMSIQNNFSYNEVVVGIDDMITVNKTFLYCLCPYLNDIKKPLVDFAKGSNFALSGSFKKITPVRTSDVCSIDSRLNLKTQLIDSLMRYVTNHTKDVMKFLTEKFYVNIKNHICDVLLPESCQKTIETLGKEFSIDCDFGELTVDELKLNNNALYKECVARGKEDFKTRRQTYIRMYLNEKVLQSVEAILPPGSHKKVILVAFKVVKHNIRSKLLEWLLLNKDLFQNELNVLYTRFIRNIIKESTM